MTKFTKNIELQMPMDVVYKNLKGWDAKVDMLLTNLDSHLGTIIEDKPNSKLSMQWKTGEMTAKLIINIKSINKQKTEVNINVDSGIENEKIVAINLMQYVLGGFKGLETGYLDAIKSEFNLQHISSIKESTLISTSDKDILTFCQKCGEELDPKLNFCPHCGKSRE